MKFVWTAEAIERLKEIDAYISQDSPANAAKFIDLLFERGDSLAEFPQNPGAKCPSTTWKTTES
jgi:plasmid stabilization system protein ParE